MLVSGVNVNFLHSIKEILFFFLMHVFRCNHDGIWLCLHLFIHSSNNHLVNVSGLVPGWLGNDLDTGPDPRASVSRTQIM